MKVSIDGKVLNGILRVVSPYVGKRKKSQPDILQTVKITATDKVYISATNLNSDIVAEVPGADVLDPGETCINFKELQQLVKGYCGPVLITGKEIKTSLTIKYMSHDYEEFSNSVEVKDYQEFTLTNEFITSLNTCLPFVSLDTIRPIFSSVWVDEKNLISTDSFVLITRKQDCIKSNKPIVIPLDQAKLLVGTFKKADSLSCRVSDGRMQVSDGANTVTIRINAGCPIPSYEKIIPTDNANEVTVNTKEFRSMLCAFPVEEKENFVFFNLGETVTLKSNLVNEIQMNCTANIRRNFEITLGLNLLKKLVNVFTDEEITLNFFGSFSPVTIKNDEITVLMVPIRS